MAARTLKEENFDVEIVFAVFFSLERNLSARQGELYIQPICDTGLSPCKAPLSSSDIISTRYMLVDLRLECFQPWYS